MLFPLFPCKYSKGWLCHVIRHMLNYHVVEETGLITIYFFIFSFVSSISVVNFTPSKTPIYVFCPVHSYMFLCILVKGKLSLWLWSKVSTSSPNYIWIIQLALLFIVMVIFLIYQYFLCNAVLALCFSTLCCSYRGQDITLQWRHNGHEGV